VPVQARATAGVAGVFLETHQDPASAPSDDPNMVPLDMFEAVLGEIKEMDDLRKRQMRAN
jgi:2-dehydro-3-deoxyphosphooctonate aldolase (KDO 8-P synthase)